MTGKIRGKLLQLFGKECCEGRVGTSRSLSIGFGNKIATKQIPVSIKYCEWEIGTYYSSWRIIQSGRIICGSNDSVDRLAELDNKVKSITFGKITGITNTNDFDVRVEFDRGIKVDFIPAISDEDEFFHVFCPDKTYIQFSSLGKWEIGKSDAPWGGHSVSKRGK